MRTLTIALVLLASPAFAQDHLRDDYWRMRGIAGQESYENQRLQDLIRELLRQHEKDMARVEEVYNRHHEVPPMRLPCVHIDDVECFHD